MRCISCCIKPAIGADDATFVASPLVAVTSVAAAGSPAGTTPTTVAGDVPAAVPTLTHVAVTRRQAAKVASLALIVVLMRQDMPRMQEQPERYVQNGGSDGGWGPGQARPVGKLHRHRAVPELGIQHKQRCLREQQQQPAEAGAVAIPMV